MTPDKILVIVVGLVAIVFVYWFFMNKKDKKAVAVSGSIDIKVEGGYNPEVISVPVGKTTTLNFTRTDPTGCLEEVVFGDFNIRKILPLNQKVFIQITPNKIGEFTYSCGMNMYHGKIIVE
ncbi:MAG: cupredoxin domain-containing protein [Candidatus Vogelbacteria bacterium]|nr:cupredoxin domain-containing protein [Candidatus Vogelbacteria bacterium]